MKAASKPFISKYDGGRCGVCRRVISKGASIVRLEKPITWIEQRRLIPRGGGMFFTDRKSTQLAHTQCLEEKEQEDEAR